MGQFRQSSIWKKKYFDEIDSIYARAENCGVKDSILLQLENKAVIEVQKFPDIEKAIYEMSECCKIGISPLEYTIWVEFTSSCMKYMECGIFKLLNELEKADRTYGMSCSKKEMVIKVQRSELRRIYNWKDLIERLYPWIMVGFSIENDNGAYTSKQSVDFGEALKPLLAGLFNLALWGGTYLYFVVRAFVIKGFSLGRILLAVYFSFGWVLYIFISIGSVITGFRLLLICIESLFVRDKDWGLEIYNIRGEGFILDGIQRCMVIMNIIGIVVFWQIAK